MDMSPCGWIRVASASALALSLWACDGTQRAPVQTDGKPAPTSVQELDCSRDGGPAVLRVRGGTLRDHLLACDALRRVLAFFGAQGRAAERRVAVEFRDTVTWEWTSAVADERVAVGSDGRVEVAERVVGLFDPARGTVMMTSEASPWLRRTTYFGQPMSDELLTTMLAHEISHALSRKLYAAHLRTADTDLRVQEECIAYVAQLVTMNTQLRATVLARFPARDAADADVEGAINALALGLAPETFGVTCFRHFAGPSGGRAFLDRLYSGEFTPSTLY